MGNPVIYKITSPSEKVYIGQSWNWIKRKSVYKRVACPLQKHLYSSLLKYGYDNHKIEIIITLPEEITQEELDNQEIKYYQLYKEQGIKLLNIKEPGKGGKLSEETKKKLSIALKGRSVLKESIEKRRETRKNSKYVMSEESRKKIGLAHKGKIISLEMREKISKKLIGRKLSKEVCEKISKSNKGRIVSKETRKKISIANMVKEGRKGKFNSISKKVIDTNTLQIFDSIKEAADFHNLKAFNLQNILNKKVKKYTSLMFLSEWKY